MPMEVMVERQPSPEQAHNFKLVLMKILFLGPKHHLGQVFYSEEIHGSYSNHLSDLGLILA